MWGVAKPGHDYRIHEAVDFVAQSSSGYFEPGQRDFVLEVGEPAALAVIARLDSDSLLRQLELCARFDENAEMAPEGVRKFPLREATLFPTQLPPGCADVEVLSTSGARLARTEGVMFRSGETTELEFDLRNRLPDIAVTLESDGGAKIGRDARVLYRESESGPYPFVAGKDRDVHRVLTTRQSVDLAILAMGHAPVELDDVSSDVTAVLHAGPTVTIPLPEGLQAWKGGWLLWALFHPKADTLARLMPPRWLAAVLKQEGLVAALPAPGTYHVEWVAMRSHSSGDPVHLGDVKDDVVVGADDERITIPFPLEAWSRFDGADHDD